MSERIIQTYSRYKIINSIISLYLGLVEMRTVYDRLKNISGRYNGPGKNDCKECLIEKCLAENLFHLIS